MKKWTREPLLHFTALGIALFLVFAWVNRDLPRVEERGSLRLTEAEVSWLRDTWSRQWRRDPTDSELRGLVADYLREELLAREARELGLDKDDIVVRRRLAQKMTFLLQDTADIAAPTDGDLHELYERSSENYSLPARLSFTHIYFNPDRRPDAAADAHAAMVTIGASAGAASETLGDPTLVPAEFTDADQATIASQFGEPFAAALAALTPGSWQGPVESGLGMHLVRVSHVTPAVRRPLNEVRVQVADQWRADRQKQLIDQYFARLMGKYDISVDERVTSLVGPLTASEEGP